jgi:hypothetical protein
VRRAAAFLLAALLLLPAAAAAQLAPHACPTTRPAALELEANEGPRPLGHTIARHVGRSDAQLARRLRDEPRISAASTFPDLATAQCVVDLTLADPRNRRRIERWTADEDQRTLALRWRGEAVVGRIMGRDGAVREAREATVVLRRAEGRRDPPWIVLTAYPDD